MPLTPPNDPSIRNLSPMQQWDLAQKAKSECSEGSIGPDEYDQYIRATASECIIKLPQLISQLKGAVQGLSKQYHKA